MKAETKAEKLKNGKMRMQLFYLDNEQDKKFLELYQREAKATESAKGGAVIESKTSFILRKLGITEEPFK